jgi:hypothetical protein
MPAKVVTSSSTDERANCPACPNTSPKPGQPAKGSEVRMIRCTAHGIAYDGEREVCPECAKGTGA